LKEAILEFILYGLQPYKVILVENPELRAKIQASAWDNPKLLSITLNRFLQMKLILVQQEIDDYIKNASETRAIPAESLQG
jgi:nitroreductase